MSKSADFFERGKSVEQSVVDHVRGDMSQEHIAASGQITESVEGTALEGAKAIGGQIWDALAPMASLGAEELSRVLNTGSAYVFHGDSIGHEAQSVEPMHGLPTEQEVDNDRGR